MRQLSRCLRALVRLLLLQQANGIDLNMEKFYLNVPYGEKDIAKNKGARWDPDKKKWYVPEGNNSLTFIKWVPELTPDNNYNLYSENYFIAESMRRCWKCSENISLYAFYLPTGYKYLDIFGVEDDWEDEVPNVWNDTCEGMEMYDKATNSVWRWSEQPCISPASYVVKISDQALQKIQKFSSSYLFGYSKTIKNSYYANHCPHCNRLQGDFMIYEEPGGAFCAVSANQARQIKLHPVKDSIFLKGGTMFSTYDFINDYTMLPL